MRATRRVLVVGTIGLAACGRIGFDEGVAPGVDEQARGSFSVGESFACAIRDGDVYCWGNREEGQDGEGGSSIPSLVPRRVPAIPDAVQVGAGRYHACIVTVDGAVWCWGGDEFGRLGNLVPGGPPTLPARVALPALAREISVAHDNTCAVLETGAVWCWGQNHHGQLGRGFVSAEGEGFAPGEVLGISDALHVSIDDDSACALRANGDVMCWGDNNQQMIDTSGSDVPSPRTVAGLEGATAIAAGGDHVCAIVGGRAACRGRSDEGELGNGQFDQGAIASVVFSTLDDYVAIEAGFAHTCAVRATGTAMCWGANVHGVIGDGTSEARSVPTAVDQLDDAVAISTNFSATCVLRADERITCWGYGARGLLGDGRSAVLGARNVPTISGATSIAAGLGFTCVTDGDDVSCWGSNDRGQLGIGSIGGAMSSPQLLSFAWPSAIAHLVAGDAHACARLEDDTIYCWGNNHVGQLGDGTLEDRSTPTLATLPPSVRVVAGAFHTCALGTDANVRCWGYNTDGQVGDGTTTQRESPVMVATNVAELAAGDHHACARSGGQVSCWGSNEMGEIGDGTLDVRTSPVAVPGIVASNIMAGGRSTCARTIDGVSCWGLNDAGVLNMTGAAYYVETPAPSMQPELFRIGGSTACTGNACWGQNTVGQVGAGRFGYFGQPTSVEGLPSEASTGSVFAISASHACAIVISLGRTVYCWGENASGEIGIGSFSGTRSPMTTVAFP
jgi:alpha-tubulin suppressor-like RCC1 family protein